MSKLSSIDQQMIVKFDRVWNAILETITRAQKFKLDDYLILKIQDYNGAWSTKTNSYGAPVKFKVVHLNDQGIAFVKRTSKSGETVGPIQSCCGTEDDTYRNLDQNFAFELDPDYADAILLEDQYDPANLHKSKKDIWKAVTEHNKACKLPTFDIADVCNLFNSVKVGDTLWTSHTGSWFVQDKKLMTPLDFNKGCRGSLRTYVKGPHVIILTVRDKNGKVKDVSPDFFHHKALYKERPRTYRELNI